MKNLRLDITKEFYRNRDAGSAYFTVTVTGKGIEISDEAFNIFSSGTFHLGAELEEKLENAGIDTYDIVEALENNSSYIIASVETSGPTMTLKERLDTYAKTALELKLFTVASRLCTALDTAHRVDMNTPEDFGGEWASIECDIETVDEAMNKANQEDLDARERYEGEQLAKGGVIY